MEIGTDILSKMDINNTSKSSIGSISNLNSSAFNNISKNRAIF